MPPMTSTLPGIQVTHRCAVLINGTALCADHALKLARIAAAQRN